MTELRAGDTAGEGRDSSEHSDRASRRFLRGREDSDMLDMLGEGEGAGEQVGAGELVGAGETRHLE